VREVWRWGISPEEPAYKRTILLCLLGQEDPIYAFLDYLKFDYSVPLRTGTSYIRDIFVLFLQDYCALQELLMKINFTIAVAPPFVHPMTSLPATPTHSVWKYGFFSEPTWRRQVAKYGNLKRCESVIFWRRRELRAF